MLMAKEGNPLAQNPIYYQISNVALPAIEESSPIKLIIK